MMTILNKPMTTKYPVSWSVDSRVPEVVHGIMDHVKEMKSYPLNSDLSEVNQTIEVLKILVNKLESMLSNPPNGKHAIPTD